jgi:hypothetical protein
MLCTLFRLPKDVSSSFGFSLPPFARKRRLPVKRKYDLREVCTKSKKDCDNGEGWKKY